ncbi:MAG: endo-1,4-beta-xylanase [Phycisphaerales bacterium]|nr:endo-1,4-beta-xylanase [Phycisphaerales bacterium]
MLSFELAAASAAVRGSLSAQSFAFGPDDVPVPGAVSIEEGAIRCAVATPESAGLSVVLDLDALDTEPRTGEPEIRPEHATGVLALKTCLLPPRERPYLLLLELARRRIMLYLNKLEQWALFDLPQSDPAAARFEAAREMFTRALVSQRQEGSQEASRLAGRALVLAIDATERLALRQAERLWADRVTGKLYADAVEHYQRVQQEKPPEGAPILLPSATGVSLPGRPLLGCSVSPGIYSDQLARLVATSCDFVSMPMRWSDLEPQEGKYSFGQTDKWIEWAVRNAKIPVAAGPVIDFRPTAVPEWLWIWENDYETLRELVAEHVKQVVTRYRRTVRRWTVASGLHVNACFPLGFEQMMDLTKICVGMVRKLHPQASIVLELTQPWGEYYAANRKSLPPQLYAEMVSQYQIPVDAFGLRVQMGQTRLGQTSRDLASYSSLLDRFAELEKPLIVTAAGVPSEPGAKQPDKMSRSNRAKAPDDMDPGFWRERWSEERQAEWLVNAFAIAMAKPFVHSVCWQELYDTQLNAEMPAGGLISASGTPKAALAKLGELRRGVRDAKWPLRTQAPTEEHANVT